MTRQQCYNAMGDLYEADRYGTPHMHLYKNYRNNVLGRIVNERFGDTKPLDILEVGCGPGLSLEYLSHLEAKHRLSGIDFSSTMIAEATQRTANLDNPPKLQEGNAYELPFENESFDVAYSTRFIHQFSHEDKKRVLEEMRRVVRPEGIIVVEFYARPYHWLRYLFGGGKGKSRLSYFYHYPTRREVGDLIGHTYSRIPVRVAGARVVHRYLGASANRIITRLSALWPLRIITDEYFIVERN